MITITIANRKGGVSKTTTAQVLSLGLAMRGYRTLAVDLDSQRSLSFVMKVPEGRATVYEVLTGERGAKAAVQHIADNLDLLPGSSRSALADTAVGSAHKLREALSYLRDSYDYCIVDCPPGLGTLTVNGLTAADWVIIPATSSAMSLMAVDPMIKSVKTVQQRGNPNLKVAGILITQWDVRPLIYRQIETFIKQQAERLGVSLFETKIRYGVAIMNAQARFANPLTYNRRSNPVKDYNAFIDELLEKIHAENK